MEWSYGYCGVPSQQIEADQGNYSKTRVVSISRALEKKRQWAQYITVVVRKVCIVYETVTGQELNG